MCGACARGSMFDFRSRRSPCIGPRGGGGGGEPSPQIAVAPSCVAVVWRTGGKEGKWGSPTHSGVAREGRRVLGGLFFFLSSFSFSRGAPGRIRGKGLCWRGAVRGARLLLARRAKLRNSVAPASETLHGSVAAPSPSAIASGPAEPPACWFQITRHRRSRACDPARHREI